MSTDFDLRELAAMSGPERAFVSLYLSSRDSLSGLDDRAKRVRRFLADQPDELEHFESSLAMLRERLDAAPIDGGGLAAFACFATDFCAAYPLAAPLPDLLWIDSSPYIRPLAELVDEYETFVVVAADHGRARVHLVSSGLVAGSKTIRGDVKNRVKKGGWSQKRYQRRRDNERLHYAKEIGELLAKLDAQEEFSRIVLLGNQEVLGELREALPAAVAAKVVGAPAPGLADPDDAEEVLAKAFELHFLQEREDERGLWERIREEALGDGLAASGPSEVLAAAREGRVEELICRRDLEVEGMRCRECELLAFAKPQQCPACKSTSVFAVDLVEEVVELVVLAGGTTDFVDPLPGLDEVGGLAALLRW
jgi:peptide subunit release factor 1 (eRF1)